MLEIVPQPLYRALVSILGNKRAHALLFDDGSGLTQAMEAAAIHAFRTDRTDHETEVLKRAFILADKGQL